ncbi:MAG: precorrin-2 dehydrogenase [Acidobacteria bacterium]|nr:MAG: precorrin-2 dehydrogenase [Acidobacteriota bacterium]
MKLYPVHVLLEGKTALVVGGGPVAAAKAGALLQSGARVRVIAPQCSREMAELIESAGLPREPREFTRADLDDVRVVVAATNRPELQQEIFEEAEARGILCCAVDDPARSNFIVPAVLRRGDLVVTVSTSGVAPALAARLRDFIGEILGDEYAEVLDRLRLAREELKSRYPDFEERREAWYRLLDTEILPALQRGERPRANTDEDGRARLQPSRYGTTKARASAPEGPHQLVMTDTSAAKASLLDTCSSGTAEPAPSRVTDAPRSADESGKEIATTPQPERAKS